LFVLNKKKIFLKSMQLDSIGNFIKNRKLRF